MLTRPVILSSQVMALLIAASDASPGQAQYTPRQYDAEQSAKYVEPLSTDCIRPFYDPSFHNWFSFQNTCSESVHLAVATENVGGDGAWNISPGGKVSTGNSRSEQEAYGRIHTYVCPRGYFPVDGADNYATSIRPIPSTYRCKKIE
jgi:hypothetical protein